MAKSKKAVNTPKEIVYAPVQNQLITDTLEKNYMPYVMSVIVSRAIPEIDGLKPSHRKLLYTMYKMGLLTSNRTKSAILIFLRLLHKFECRAITSVKKYQGCLWCVMLVLHSGG